jgi:hypothetical protein
MIWQQDVRGKERNSDEELASKNKRATKWTIGWNIAKFWIYTNVIE